MWDTTSTLDRKNLAGGLQVAAGGEVVGVADYFFLGFGGGFYLVEGERDGVESVAGEDFREGNAVEKGFLLEGGTVHVNGVFVIAVGLPNRGPPCGCSWRWGCRNKR